MMYNTQNPAELYPNTTWELLTANKHLKTTTGTPLATGGSNSVAIVKANLPKIKLKVDNHVHTKTAHLHSLTFGHWDKNTSNPEAVNAITYGSQNAKRLNHNTALAGGENTSGSAPNTELLGSGAPLTINPEYITIRAWKRLS